MEAHENGIESRVEVELRGLSIYTHHGVSDSEQEVGHNSAALALRNATSDTVTRGSRK